MSSSPSDFPFRLSFPPELPISARADEITQAIRDHAVVILAGETGSGKTTQIPKMCLAAGRGQRGRIACTQPRRVAALSISRRVAEEMGVTWGKEVGCRVRFTDQTSDRTVVKFMTDGMLLAEVQSDPLLRAYDTIVIDEAHERSLNIDFLLGHLRTLRYKRPELKIVVTSATLDTEAFSQAFDGAPVIQVSGRTYPVEVIYMPLDEFGSDAAEGDEREARSEALHYIDGTLEAVHRILTESDSGDLLVFLPTERDILEVRDVLEGRVGKRCEIVPLFGRLTNAEQQRVFSSAGRRKIVLSTNIAETSLTIPGIRFVVDTGLARISRYAAGSRTRRLPIEPVAQSSAEQRKGRSGRVAEGVCIRLYSEKDYNERPRFAQPEIQRANLADVILRMKAYGLGDIERFPFLNMPASKSIRAGYALLEELGAIEESRDGEHRLTPIGRELARLPVDPTVGRMILQARTEKCLREVLIIAAGLSIQDPRERPLEKQAQADAAHRRFRRPDSDFLTLLALWEAYHDDVERMSQGRLRRFCHEHFISYTRMREWRDIHTQLVDVLKERDDYRLTSVWDGVAKEEISDERLLFGTSGYRAIHRSILAGLLGNIAQRDEEGGGYKATLERRVSLFPGSVLYVREEPKRKEKSEPKAAKKAPPPRWIMSAEIMETSRLYARTSARLDPQWVLDLGQHLLKVTYSEPFWQEEGGRVLVKRKSRLYGLEMESRAVGYGRVDPVHATEIFIREGLVNDAITWPFDFLAHNRRLLDEIEALLTRTRDRHYMNLEEAIYRFYAARLQPEVLADGTEVGISAVAELVDYVRQRQGKDPQFLFMKREDLRDPAADEPDHEAYPEALPVDNRVLPLHYTYRPGHDSDGVSLEVPVTEAALLTPATLDWAIPGHLETKVEHYLRSAPKDIRRLFIPLAEATRTISRAVAQRDRLTARRETLLEALCAHLREAHGVHLTPAQWADKPLPSHLTVRVRVVDERGEELCSGRDLAQVQAVLAARSRDLSAASLQEEPHMWREARKRWERAPQTEWTFGDLPGQVVIGDRAGVPVVAFPALREEGDGVALRLCAEEAQAAAFTNQGLRRLLELSLKYELAWLEKDLRSVRDLGPLVATLSTSGALQEDVFVAAKRELCSPQRVVRSASGGYTVASFQAVVAAVKQEVRGLAPRLQDQLREVLETRQSLLVHPQPYPQLQADLDRLFPARFLRGLPLPRLKHYGRYLRAMKLRADRWRQNKTKDEERARQIAPYDQGLRDTPLTEPLRWLVEEYRVSLFAQEVGTAEPVSAQKLEAAWQQYRGSPPPAPGRPAAESAPAKPAPKPLPNLLQKPSQPLKSLNALDRLFGR